LKGLAYNYTQNSFEYIKITGLEVFAITSHLAYSLRSSMQVVTSHTIGNG